MAREATFPAMPDTPYPEPIAQAVLAAFGAARLTRDYAALLFNRPLEKDAAIRRIMATLDNAGKPHSYSSAEKLVEADPTYAAYCATVREAEFHLEEARAHAWAARLMAEIAARPEALPLQQEQEPPDVR